MTTPVPGMPTPGPNPKRSTTMRHPAWAVAAVILALIVAYHWVTGGSAGRDDGDTVAAIAGGATANTSGLRSFKVQYPVGSSYVSSGPIQYLCARNLNEAWAMAARLDPSPIVYGRGGDNDNCS